MKKLITVIGARPQFIKHFSFERAAKKYFEVKTIHTGQHYDKNMSEIFFQELKMRKPDYMLKVGSNSHGKQTGQMMIDVEEIILREKPDAIIVYGDTNSTLAGALVASKLVIPLVHIEAGLRSFNREMPEEINRVLTDHLSSQLFVPSLAAKSNLAQEGINKNVYVVGDIMKDLILFLTEKELLSITKNRGNYLYATIHRPYNTDDKKRLLYILENLNRLHHKVILTIHPRTRHAMKTYGVREKYYKNITFIDPQSYVDNLSYLTNSKGLITDSGGMQKEAYWLKKKCVTLRPETEWIETLANNWNTLVFDDLERINEAIVQQKNKGWNEKLYGEGDTSSQIIEFIDRNL